MKKRGHICSLSFFRNTQKRGQLTIFIIIGILIFLSIVAFYIISPVSMSFNERFFSGRGLDRNTQNIRDNIFNCIEETTTMALVTIGVQGGYYSPPKNYFDLNISFFPYYYYKGEYNKPIKSEIEESISEYINHNLKECFKSKEYPEKIEFSSINTKTIIENHEVFFEIDSNIAIETDDIIKTVELKEMDFSKESNLNGMIEIAEYLTEYHKNEDPIYYCINCLAQMAYERGVNAEIFPFIEKDTVQVLIYDEITNFPDLFIFTYLNKHIGNETSLFHEYYE